MNWIIENWSLCLSFALDFIAGIVGIVVFAKTRNIMKSIAVADLTKKTLNEKVQKGDEMKYKTLDSVQKNPPEGQSFSPYRDEFILNEATGEIEKLPIQKNVQDYINSYIDSALEVALEKLLPKDSITESKDPFEGYTRRVEDLGALSQAMEIAEEYRDRYGLSNDMSVADIYSFIDGQAKELKEKLTSRVVEQKKKEVCDVKSSSEKVE